LHSGQLGGSPEHDETGEIQHRNADRDGEQKRVELGEYLASIKSAGS